MNEREEYQRLEVREISLPPTLRSNKPKLRNLRDCLYGQYILANSNDKLGRARSGDAMRNFLALAEQTNNLGQLREIEAELVAQLEPEEIDWARKAAKTLFMFELEKRRKK